VQENWERCASAGWRECQTFRGNRLQVSTLFDTRIWVLAVPLSAPGRIRMTHINPKEEEILLAAYALDLIITADDMKTLEMPDGAHFPPCELAKGFRP
jgi:hypothetical protein